MSKNERQIDFQVSGLHVREAGEDGAKSRVIEGHAVVFNQRSCNLVPWSSRREIYEVMWPGSIDQDLINRSDVVLTAYHNNEKILGRSTNGQGTLKLEIDATGLLIRCELPNTATADEMLELIERGDVCGMSFAYTADEEDNENAVSYERTSEPGADGKEVWIRNVKKCNGLYDVTIAGHPAYSGTDVSKSEREAFDCMEKRCQGEDNSAEEAIEKQKREAEAEADRLRKIQMNKNATESFRFQ